MFCPNCGTHLEDSAVFCTSCGSRVAGAEAAPAASIPEAPVSEPTFGTYSEPAYTAQPEPTQNVWQQEAPAASSPYESHTVSDYMVINIILTVVSAFACCFSCISFCGIITGIVGIVFSSQVKNAVQAQDWALAEQKSRTAKVMWIVTAVILAISVLFFIVIMASGVSQAMLEELSNMGY